MRLAQLRRRKTGQIIDLVSLGRRDLNLPPMRLYPVNDVLHAEACGVSPREKAFKASLFWMSSIDRSFV
jgi:hypothetical protein